MANAELWTLHQQRAALALRTARTGGPQFQATTRDPFALRGLLLLLLATGIVIAGPAAPSRLSDAFTLPAWPFPGPSVNAWITPPAYDPSPPILLTPGQPATALAGSRLTLIINGVSAPPGIRLPGTGFADTALAAGSFRADATLTQTGRLRIGPWWHRLAQLANHRDTTRRANARDHHYRPRHPRHPPPRLASVRPLRHRVSHPPPDAGR